MSRDGTDGPGVEELVRFAGPRTVPPAFAAARARAHVHAAWRAGIRRRRILQAAVLVGAVGVATVAYLARSTPERLPRAAAPAPVARLGAGDAESGSGSAWTILAAGSGVAPGTLVRTHEGASFVAGEGRSIRLRKASRLRFVSADRLALDAGSVYVDSGGGRAASSFEVATAWGVVHENGTQFEVAVDPAGLRIRVREGRVAVLGRGPALDAAAGSELRIDARGAARRAIPSFGPEWEWAVALAPPFELEGRSLDAFLAWAVREGGWRLHYADAESRLRASTSRLHGSVRGLAPHEALSAAVPAAGMAYRLESGTLRIGPVEP